MTPDLASLTRHPLLWRGKQAAHQIQTLASGHAALDAALPGHGWPTGAVTELIHATPGCGELSLLLPALACLSQEKRRIIMLDPPWIPYPPALLAWPESLSFSAIRRLQLAAESGQTAVFLFRHANTASDSSPAALRLQLTADDGDLQIRILKCRGQRAAAAIRIRRPNSGSIYRPTAVSVVSCRSLNQS